MTRSPTRARKTVAIWRDWSRANSTCPRSIARGDTKKRCTSARSRPPSKKGYPVAISEAPEAKSQIGQAISNLIGAIGDNPSGNERAAGTEPRPEGRGKLQNDPGNDVCDHDIVQLAGRNRLYAPGQNLNPFLRTAGPYVCPRRLNRDRVDVSRHDVPGPEGSRGEREDARARSDIQHVRAGMNNLLKKRQTPPGCGMQTGPKG